jgi:hypothetical protein
MKVLFASTKRSWTRNLKIWPAPTTWLRMKYHGPQYMGWKLSAAFLLLVSRFPQMRLFA